MTDPPEAPPGLRIMRGDATDPQASGPKIIAHVCNNRGVRVTVYDVD